MSKVEELAIQVGMTVLGIIWSLGAGDRDEAEYRAREILSTCRTAQEMQEKIDKAKDSF
jgi:hypothetical protein